MRVGDYVLVNTKGEGYDPPNWIIGVITKDQGDTFKIRPLESCEHERFGRWKNPSRVRLPETDEEWARVVRVRLESNV